MKLTNLITKFVKQDVIWIKVLIIYHYFFFINGN